MEQPKWWRTFNPNLTLSLLIIILFLVIIGIGNLFGVYQFLTEGNISGAMLAVFSTLLYFIPAYGLFKLKRWARFIELFLSLLLVGLGMILIFTGISNRELFNLATQGVIITVIHGAIAAYLLTDRCRKAFGYQPSIKQPEPLAASTQQQEQENKVKEQAD